MDLVRLCGKKGRSACMSFSENTLGEIHSVQQLYEQLRSATPVKGVFLGREVSFGNQSKAALSDIVDKFRTLVQEGRISSDEGGIENEVKYIHLCAKKIKTLNKDKGTIPTPLQMYRKKEVKEIETGISQVVKTAHHLSDNDKLISVVAAFFYKQFSKADIDKVDSLVKIARNFINHPLEGQEETMTSLYKLCALGGFSLTQYFHHVICASFNDLKFNVSDSAWDELIHSVFEIEHHRLPYSPSQECEKNFKKFIPKIPSKIINDFKSTLYKTPAEIVRELKTEAVKMQPSEIKERVNYYFYDESQQTQENIYNYVVGLSNLGVVLSERLGNFESRMNFERINSFIDNTFGTLPCEPKRHLREYLSGHSLLFQELPDLDSATEQIIDQKIEHLEQSWLRRVGTFETGSAQLTSEEKKQLKDFFVGKTTHPPDLSRINALWDRQILEIDKVRLYNFIHEEFVGIKDEEALPFLFFLQGKTEAPPEWIKNEEHREHCVSLIKALLADNLPQYRTMALRLEESIIDKGPQEDIGNVKKKITEYFSATKSFGNKQEEKLLGFLADLFLNPNDHIVLEGLEAYLVDIKSSTVLPQKKIDDLIGLSNILFASNEKKQQKLAVQLASAIPLMNPLADESTWIRNQTMDEMGMVGMGDWNNTFEQKVYSDQVHFKKFSPELFSTLSVWQICKQGYHFWGSNKRVEYRQEFQDLTENFLFYNMPGLTPFPFQGRLHFVLQYREKELPERFKPYAQKLPL